VEEVLNYKDVTPVDNVYIPAREWKRC